MLRGTSCSSEGDNDKRDSWTVDFGFKIVGLRLEHRSVSYLRLGL